MTKLIPALWRHSEYYGTLIFLLILWVVFVCELSVCIVRQCLPCVVLYTTYFYIYWNYRFSWKCQGNTKNWSERRHCLQHLYFNPPNCFVCCCIFEVVLLFCPFRSFGAVFNSNSSWHLSQPKKESDSSSIKDAGQAHVVGKEAGVSIKILMKHCISDVKSWCVLNSDIDSQPVNGITTELKFI